MNDITKRQQKINAFEEELAKSQNKLRKEDTRRKILVGAMILNKMENNPQLREQILSSLNEFLTRKNDRKLFNLGDSDTTS